MHGPKKVCASVCVPSQECLHKISTIDRTPTWRVFYQKSSHVCAFVPHIVEALIHFSRHSNPPTNCPDNERPACKSCSHTFGHYLAKAYANGMAEMREIFEELFGICNGVTLPRARLCFSCPPARPHFTTDNVTFIDWTWP